MEDEQQQLEKKLQGLENLVSSLIEKGQYQNALYALDKTLKHSRYVVHDSACALIKELSMKVNHILGNNAQAFSNAMLSLKYNEGSFKNVESYLIAAKLHQHKNEIQAALMFLEEGLSRFGKESLKDENLKTQFLQKHDEIKGISDVADAFLAQESETSTQQAKGKGGKEEKTQHQAEEEIKERELLDEEESRNAAEARKREKKREKREGKQIAEGSKKAVETKDEGDGSVETKDEEDGRGSISLVEDRRPRNFEITLAVTVESDEDSYMGSIRTNTTEVQKSFIAADQAQLDNLQDLVRLCLRHEILLKVDLSFKMMDEHCCFLATSEDVCTLFCFFKRKFINISPESNEVWWYAIKDLFWKVFRAVIRGLIYLFNKDKSCGDLAFNTFVNSEGEGRILPSMKARKQKEDLIQLVDLMKSVIKLPVPSQSDSPFLPYHLRHFFKTVTEFHRCCPLEFVIDHPYFWNTTEKISFTFKLRELVKRDPTPFLNSLKDVKVYKEWPRRLQHVYKRLFDNAKKRKLTIKAYRNSIDIVRYYGAVYTHINELEYKKGRNKKRFSDEKIESDLSGFFPDFYVDMFWCVCSCNREEIMSITNDDLRRLSTVLSFRGK